MKTNRKAQSVLEYTLIVILVMIALITAGPYLINSVKSYFRMTDASVARAWSDKAALNSSVEVPRPANLPD